MKKLLSSAVATAVLTTGALAADLPARVAYAPPPAFSWNGCYVGARVQDSGSESWRRGFPGLG
jgi:opacity protein-like surface antigen